MYKLICMSFDGDYVTEGSDFPTVKSAWERDNDLGSRWIFYPFHFVTTASGKTVKDAPECLERFIGKKVVTVKREFAQYAALPEAQNMGPDEFSFMLYHPR